MTLAKDLPDKVLSAKTLSLVLIITKCIITVVDFFFVNCLNEITNTYVDLLCCKRVFHLTLNLELNLTEFLQDKRLHSESITWAILHSVGY